MRRKAVAKAPRPNVARILWMLVFGTLFLYLLVAHMVLSGDVNNDGTKVTGDDDDASEKDFELDPSNPNPKSLHKQKHNLESLVLEGLPPPRKHRQPADGSGTETNPKLRGYAE